MKRKILFLSLWYPNNTDNMLGLFVRKQALALAEKYNVSVISAVGIDKRDKPGVKIRVVDDKLKEIIVYYNSSKFKILNLIRFFTSYMVGYTFYRKKYGKPELIHANILTRVGFIAYLLSKFYGIKYVVSEHWSRYYKENLSYKSWIRKYLTNKVASKAEYIIVPSERLQNAMIEQKIRGSYVVVPNVVDTDLFTIASDKAGNKTKQFVHISCFEDKSKNISMLFKAVKLLKQRRTDFELIMIGDGEDKAKMEELAENLNIKDKVVFKGQLEDDELADVVSHADCCVLSSRYETFGIVVYEALSSGLPVLSTDVADVKKHIDGKYGIIVKIHDASNFANAMDVILNKLEDFSPYELRAFIVENFSKEQVKKHLDHIYQKCLK